MGSTLVRIAVKVLISGGLIVLVLSGVDISGIYSLITKASNLSIAIALMLLTGIALIQAERWRIILSQLSIKLVYSNAIKLVLISYFFNQTLPSTVGGDVFKVWGAYRNGISLDDAFSSVIVDRIVALVSLLLLIVSCSPWLLDLYQSPSTFWILGFLLAAGSISFILFMGLDHFASWLRRWRVGRIILSINICARAVLLNIRIAINVVALTIISYLVLSFVVYLLARGMMIDLEFKHSLLLMPLVILVTILPVSIAGWGVREGAMVVALGLIGMPSVEALSLSILFGLVGLVSGLPGGLIWLLEHYGRNKVRDAELALHEKDLL